MRDLFDPCVDGVLELILGQILQVESQGSRVKVKALNRNWWRLKAHRVLRMFS